MPASERWHPWRIALFLLLGGVLYACLFFWSDRMLRAGATQSPFLAVTTASAEVDWLILGASHAVPLDTADVPDLIAARMGKTTEVLAAPGIGPFVLRMLAERWFIDHRSRAVLILIDDFGFADRRWNEDRLAEDDLLPKIPADSRTARVLFGAVARGLPWQSWLAQVTGFARINDRRRFAAPTWTVADRFDRASRPSAAAIRSRLAFLYPAEGEGRSIDAGLADLEATVLLARRHGARVVLLRPPLPAPFRAALPEVPGLVSALDALAHRRDVAIIDHSARIPDPRHYFDTDHLNRSGVMLWLDDGLGALLAGNDGGQ